MTPIQNAIIEHHKNNLDAYRIAELTKCSFQHVYYTINRWKKNELVRSIRQHKVLCKCPRCNVMHKIRMNWTGREKIPRFYCEACRRVVENDISDGMAIGYDDKRDYEEGKDDSEV